MVAPYAFRLAFQSVLREKWINLLSTLTIATGLLIITFAVFSVYNIDAATKKLPEKFSIMLYLDDNLPGQELENVINTLRKDSAVETVRYISRDDALKELKGTLKDANYVLEGLGENPLPDSIELKLKKEAVGPETAKRLATDAKKIKGVNEVEYGEKFLSSIYSIKVGMKVIVLTLIIATSAGIIFVCYSTVKILFYRRTDEIETYKLLGATRGFVRAPFIIEGALIGTAGGLLSLIGIISFYYMVLLKLTLTIPLFKAILFPTNIFLLLPVTGLFLGITGAVIALGRLRF
ncbi:MAG: permease-like cell division protein FtsX [Nitrospirota bacterium]